MRTELQTAIFWKLYGVFGKKTRSTTKNATGSPENFKKARTHLKKPERSQGRPLYVIGCSDLAALIFI